VSELQTSDPVPCDLVTQFDISVLLRSWWAESCWQRCSYIWCLLLRAESPV